jgi:hypothetical protein
VLQTEASRMKRIGLEYSRTMRTEAFEYPRRPRVLTSRVEPTITSLTSTNDGVAPLQQTA